jgi:serine phosphatase RsbU (regulator of sigma subunit)
VTSGRPELERLLGRDAIRAFLDAIGSPTGGGATRLLPPDVDAGDVARPITLDGRRVAWLVGPDDDRTLSAAAAGLELAVREAAARRAVSAEAIEAYRELALLYRIGDAIGASLDPAVIGPVVLEEARRVLRADAAAIEPLAEATTPDLPIPASASGEAAAVARLRRDAQPAIAHAVATGSAGTAGHGRPGSPGARSVVVAPMLADGRPRAVLVLARGGTPFASGDMKLVVALAQHAAGAFERAALHRANTDRLRLEHDLALGRRIQLSLLPHVLPQPDGWEVGAAYEPAREVGGDFYDVFPVRDVPGSVGFVIADVTGKGIPAALMMAFARPLIRAAADQTNGPAEALARVNRILVDERRSTLFITALHLRLQLRTATLTWASAGHEPPILVPGDGGRSRRLPTGGALLGAFRDLPCAEHTIGLAPGDLVIAYTDGVTDARRADGERFGEARLSRAAHATAGLSAPEAARSILDAVHRFAGDAPRADDIALLTLRRSPASRSTRRHG